MTRAKEVANPAIDATMPEEMGWSTPQAYVPTGNVTALDTASACGHNDRVPIPALTDSPFDRYLADLAAVAEARTDVIGLAGFGSTADRTRVDEWSDHDFAWVTVPGAQDSYRHDLTWLPGAEGIALSVVEHHGGVKVIYDDGRVLEFGITSLGDFTAWAGNSIEVIVDKGGVAEAVATILSAPLPEGEPDADRAIRLVLTQLLIGVGRYRRGEVLSAGRSIRDEATAYLLTALGARLAGATERLDTLDPRRRFDFVHPEIAVRIEAALRLDPESAARQLLAIAESAYGEGFPARGASALRSRLGWS